MNSSSDEEFQPQAAAGIATIVVMNIIWWMMMITAIVLGATHLGFCPVQPYIPIFLIVYGVTSILAFSLTSTKDAWKDGAAFALISACTTVVHLFSFSWFIAGNYWVYSVYPPSYVRGESRYCHNTTFLFAFAVITVTWVLLGLVFVGGCCFAVLSCCTTLQARERLIPTRNSFYGSTSSKEPAAGDV